MQPLFKAFSLGSLLWLTLFSNLISQSILHVPADFKDIQSALNAANEGDLILVKPGRYYENLKWPEVNGISLLSEGDEHNTFIDGNGKDRVIEIYSSTTQSSKIDQATVIKGFTILNGLLTQSDWAYGAGIYVSDASPLLMNLIIRDNICVGEWAFGGGLYLDNSNALIENVEITDNILRSSSWSFGAGVYCGYVSKPHFKNVLISKNKHETGALWNYGGGVSIEDSKAVFTNAIISSNVIEGKSGNWYYGGGISCTSFSDSASIELINCTIFNNYCTATNLTGEGVYIDGADGKIINSIVWNNFGNNNAIVAEEFLKPINLEVSYSNIKSGWNGIGNINSDPLFLDKDLYILKPESPCLGTGTLIGAPQVDFLGNPRPRPIRSNPDMGAIEMDQDFSHAIAVIYFDRNKNKVFDDNEKIQQSAAIYIESLNKSMYYNNPNGILAILPMGLHKISLNKLSLPGWKLTTNNDFFIENVDSRNFSDTIYFGIIPEVYYSNLVTTIYSPPTRCNGNINFSVSIKNDGTQIENGIFYFKMDTRISNFTFKNQYDFFISPDIYGWKFNDLFPGESLIKCINISVPGVAIIPSGEKLHFKSYVQEDPINNSIRKNEFCYDPEVRCSFDPNDKNVNPSREGGYALFDEDLIYTIRFQNTGNDYAYKVIIRDTLDKNLDWSSFEILNSSHFESLNTELNSQGIITFEFNNILLPYKSLNEEASHGFVSYKIHPKSNLTEKDAVDNSASIYFDYNPPIFTNSVRNILVQKIPTQNYNPIDNEINYNLFPNPAKEEVTILYDSDKPITCQIYNSIGLLIKSIKMNSNQKISISTFADGIYTFDLISGNKHSYIKLIVQK